MYNYNNLKFVGKRKLENGYISYGRMTGEIRKSWEVWNEWEKQGEKIENGGKTAEVEKEIEGIVFWTISGEGLSWRLGEGGAENMQVHTEIGRGLMGGCRDRF